MICISTEKSRLKAKVGDNNKLINNVANNGVKIGDCAIMSRNGEYNGFSIKFLENVHPLLTDRRINIALNYYKNEQIEDTIRTLCIYEEYVKSNKNRDVIDFVLCQWLNKADINLKENNLGFIKNVDKIDDCVEKKLLERVHTVSSSPIIGKMEIIALGKSTNGNTVVPESWLGYEFNNGAELHNEMDKLEWRVNSGRPPVSFCCIYSMMILDKIQWISDDMLKTKKTNNFIFVGYDEKGFVTKNVTKNKKNMQYMILEKQQIVLGINKKYLQKKDKVKIKYSIGHLSSLMQKCFRRGLGTNTLLRDTMTKMSNAKSYNLPDINFAKVSGWRQLFWRLYISIIEDVTPFMYDDDGAYNLLDIVIFAIISHYDPDIDFNYHVVDKILKTGTMIINHTESHKIWNWRDGDINEIKYDIFCKNNDDNLQSMILVAKHNLMPMMNNDKLMMIKSANYYKNHYQKNVPKFITDDESFIIYDDDSLAYETLLASHDMHCCPNILIIGNQNLNSELTMKKLGSFIWNNISSVNVHIPLKETTNINLSREDKKTQKIISQIQHQYFYGEHNFDPSQLRFGEIQKSTKKDKKEKIPKNILRDIFLLLFGKKISLSGYDAIIAGDVQNPLKIKKRGSTMSYININHTDYAKQKIKYVEKMKKTTIKIPNICLKNSDIKIKWKKNIIKKSTAILSVNFDENNKMEFYVNGVKLNDAFDSSNIIELIDDNIEITNVDNLHDDKYKNIIKCAMSNDKCDYYLIRTLEIIHKYKLNNDIHIVVDDWDKLCDFSQKHNAIIWKQLYTRIIMRTNNVIYVGPVDRNGNKMQNSISQFYEGIIWRLLQLMSVLYPRCIHQRKRGNNDTMNFICNENVPEYDHMTKIINKLIYGKIKTSKIKIKNETPKIVTTLWNHQKDTVVKMTNGYKNENIKGYGDASHVGAGKTLTSLNTFVNLYDDKDDSHCGFLVLLPTSQLLNTWKTEIDKHTKNFDVILFNDVDYKRPQIVNKNTIVISTLGKMRDHPIIKHIEKKWSLVVIDECLSVQNRDALQTEEAWRQIINSRYGVLMMSATFFRSRFDKLFYMLKMLQSNLPENDCEYLDCILNEHMICNITENDRIWKTNINRIKMNKKIKLEYDKIKKEETSNEQKYIKLQKLIYDKVNYVNIFYDLIIKLINGDDTKKILVYGNSKHEADNICNKNNNLIGRYPDISKNIVVVALSEATYGLNDLVKYDTLIIRPPMPDLLPQIKGRLDRAGQKSKILNLEYVLLDECSIEEISLFRLDMANNFYNNYIMPIAEFYDMAVNG